MSRPEVTANYSQAQLRMMELCERIYVHKDTPLNEFTIWLSDEPATIRQRAAATFLGLLLLPPNESFAAANFDQGYPEVSLRQNVDTLVDAGLVVYKSTWPARGKTGGREALYDLSLRFTYAQDDEQVSEEVGMETATVRVGSVPIAFGNLWASAYAESGYEGHDMRSYQPTSEEALGALALFDELSREALPSLPSLTF